MNNEQISDILDAQDDAAYRELNYKLAWIIAVGLVAYKLASF